MSEEYYWVWRFATEMPERDGEAWVRSMSPLYAPGDGTWNTRRSNEMLYRSWRTMEAYAHGADEPAANEAAGAVRKAFLGEFAGQILSGKRGWRAWWTARRFVRSFITVPAGEFQMGSAEGKGGVPDEERRVWQSWLREGRDDSERHVEEFVSRYTFPPGKQGKALRDEWRDSCCRPTGTKIWTDPTAILPEQRNARDATAEGRRVPDESFADAQWLVSLVRSGARSAPTEYTDNYARISGRSNTPAIYVSWYDAWAFCVWAHWDGQSCRLPQEHEWEYAAKAGTPWDRNYWWGDEFDASKCNANKASAGRPLRADEHANPWGFRDILGNVWEWCAGRISRAVLATPTRPQFRPCVAWRLVGQLCGWLRSAFRNYRPSCGLRRQCWFSRGQGSTKTLILFPLSSSKRAKRARELFLPSRSPGSAWERPVLPALPAGCEALDSFDNFPGKVAASS